MDPFLLKTIIEQTDYIRSHFNKDFIDKLLQANYKIPSRCFEHLVSNKDLDMITYLYDNGFINVSWLSSKIVQACKENFNDFVYYVSKIQSVVFTKEACNEAILAHNYPLARFLLKERMEGIDKDMLIKELYQRGDLEGIQWCKKTGLIQETSIGIDYFLKCLSSGNKELVVSMLSNIDFDIAEYPERILEKSIQSKKLDIFDMMIKKYHTSMELMEKIQHWGLQYGCLDLLLKYFQKGPLFPIEDSVVGDIYNKGYKKVVEWVLSYDSLKRYTLMDNAASKGDLRMLMKLHKRGYKTSIKALEYACNNGHLLVVKYLTIQCKEGFSEKAVLNALREGYFDIFEWLRDTYPSIKNNKEKYIQFCKEHDIKFTRLQ
jgi:hypothetical protein